MSQWVKATSEVLKNVKPSILERACKNLSLSMDYTITRIDNPWGFADVDCGFKNTTTNNALAIGLKFSNTKQKQYKSAEIRGDFFDTRWADQEEFANELSQQYRKIDLVDTAEQNGYTVEEETVKENGDIQLVVSAF